MRVQSLGQGDPLEKGKATHSSILAWRIPRTEEPWELQSMGEDSVTTERLTHTHTHTNIHSFSEFFLYRLLQYIEYTVEFPVFYQ